MLQKNCYQLDLGLWFLKEFIEKEQISLEFLAAAIKEKTSVISNICEGRRKFSGDIDIKLCLFFHKEKGFFMKKQIEYDLLNSGPELLKIMGKMKKFDSTL